jgi:glyoxylase I family protein
MFRILEIDHVVIRARDAARLVRFYCDVLGCTVERRQEAIGLIQLRAGRSLIDIVGVDGTLGRKGGAAPGVEGRNMDHLCLRVDAFDVDAIRQHLEANGARVGEFGWRFGAQGEGPSLYLEDPEGNTIELKGPPAPRPAGPGDAPVSS